MLVRTEAYKQCGGMDEVTYVYEETEWHYRLQKAGWRIAFVHTAEVIHYGSETIKRTPHAEIEQLKSTLHFFRKHRTRGEFFVLRLGLSVVFALRMVKALLRICPDELVLARHLLAVTRSPEKYIVGKVH